MRTATKRTTFQPSNEVERWIESFGVTWEYLPELPLGEVDEKASLNNQARRDPLDRETGQTYTEAMRQGAVFPGLVGRRRPDGSVELCDGNHRYAGAKATPLENVGCYIVQCSDTATWLDMVASANATLNGKEAATDDRLYHGMRLIDSGHSQKQAARLAGVSTSTLSQFTHHQYVSRAAAKHGASRDAKALPRGYAKAVSTNLERLEPGIFKALLSAASHARNAQEFGALVKTVVASNGHAEQVIEEFVEDNQAINSPKATRRKSTVSPLNSFLMHGAAITKFSPEEVLASCAPEDLARLRQLAEDVRYVASRVAVP